MAPLDKFPTPTSLVSEFELSPMAPEDFDGAVTCFQAAFNSPEERFWWSPDLNAMREFHRASMARNVSKPDRRYYKIIHLESGQLAAWASWSLPKGFKGLGGVTFDTENREVVGAGKEIADLVKDDAEEKEVTAEEKCQNILDQFPVPVPKDASREALEHAIMLSEDVSERHGVKDMVSLAILCTHPAFERKGLGKALAQPMLAVAAAESVPVWVESSPKGRGFYEKLGFVPQEVSEIDLTKGNKGLRGAHKVTNMKWVPPNPADD